MGEFYLLFWMCRKKSFSTAHGARWHPKTTENIHLSCQMKSFFGRWKLRWHSRIVRFLVQRVFKFIITGQLNCVCHVQGNVSRLFSALMSPVTSRESSSLDYASLKRSLASQLCTDTWHILDWMLVQMQRCLFVCNDLHEGNTSCR